MLSRLEKAVVELRQPAVHLFVEPLHGVFVNRDRRQGRVGPSREELVGHGRAFSVPTDCRGGQTTAAFVVFSTKDTLPRFAVHVEDLVDAGQACHRSKKRERAPNATGELRIACERRRRRR
jgi:hypothetical protein